METPIDDMRPLHDRHFDEPVLPDDYPVHQGFAYIANGKLRIFIDGTRMTVGLWKQLRIPGVEPVLEVRRYDRAGRLKRLTEKVENKEREEAMRLEHDLINRINEIPVETKQKKRKSRKTYKIKRVS